MKTDRDENLTPLPEKLEAAYKKIVHGIEEVLPADVLRKKLLKADQSNTPLVIKAGFDPTAPDLHLGHTVLLQKLKTFQELGHHVYFLIGDYTAMIGDPTGKSETRKPLTEEEVLKNAQTYKDQVFKILDPEKTKIVFNSKWLEKLNLKSILSLTAKYTVARLLERDDFSKRYQSGQPISLVEFLYPLMQGYDSVEMKADVELGGTDQKFNLLVGRDLQAQYGQEPQCIITLPLLVGLDGEKKMSKSLGNYVSIQEEPGNIYGKLMSISDDLMWQYFALLSDLSLDQIEAMKNEIINGTRHPKEVKSFFSEEITARFHSKEIAAQAKAEWDRIHNPDKRGVPDDIPLCKLSANEAPNGSIGILNGLRLSGLVSSNGEAKRLIQSGGLYLLINEEDAQTVHDEKMELKTGRYTFRSGKRKFITIEVP